MIYFSLIITIIAQDLVDKFDGVYRSRPATYFEEKPPQPLTLDQVLREYTNKGKKKKKVVKRLINTDKKKQDIKNAYRLGKKFTEKITKRVEKFLYLSNLQHQSEKQKVKKTKTEDKSRDRYIGRPMTSRGNRIKICTDMQIRSLESPSPRLETTTANTHSKGRATFYSDRKQSSVIKTRNTLLKEHNSQSKILHSRSNIKRRPFTARLSPPNRD